MKLLVCVVLVSIVGLCQTRHIHPGSKIEHIVFENQNIEEAPVEVIYLKPTRFVPINSESFFKTNEPCQDGFMRDIFGICREVWD